MKKNIYNLPYFLMLSMCIFLVACVYAYDWSGYYLRVNLHKLCWQSVNPAQCIDRGI